MAHIDYFFSTISPYAYLAGNALEGIAAKHSVSITYKPLDVMALFGRTGGLPLGERHPSRQDYRLQDLSRQAKKRGLKINVQPAHFPTNAAPSSYAIIAAQADGTGDVGGLVQSLLASCWSEEKNIAEDKVIKSCLITAGFDPWLADGGLLSGAETYAANLEEAVHRGVFGSPFYLLDDGAAFFGQDRLGDLDAYLLEALDAD